MLEKLIGAQVVDISEDTIKVKLNDEIYDLKLETDQGDCCGYADFTTNLLYDKHSERNPIITNIEIVSSEEEQYCDRVKITFYGEYKPLIEIDAEAGSGSGWAYGACVELYCKELDINKRIASW